MTDNVIWDENKYTLFVKIPSDAEGFPEDSWYAIEGIPTNLKVGSSTHPAEAERKLSKEVYEKLAKLSGKKVY